VFAWNYDDLKDYDRTIFQHIPLREEANPVNKKNKDYEPQIKTSGKG
jgi:hypothetical protein